MMEKDNLLFLNVGKGSKSAFAELFSLYYSRLCLFVYDICRDKKLAEDIVQDFFLNIWNEKGNIRIKTSVKSYFYQSVYNRILNHFNRQKIHEKYKKNYLENNILRNINYYSNNSYPLANLLQKELEDKIVETIDSLPPQCRKVFTFSRFEDLKYDEISDKMNISVNSVKTHLKNALQKLRNALEEYLP